MSILVRAFTEDGWQTILFPIETVEVPFDFDTPYPVDAFTLNPATSCST